MIFFVDIDKNLCGGRLQRWLEQFEEDYKEVIKTAVGGAAGVSHLLSFFRGILR